MNNLRYLRQKHNLSQLEVANYLGLTSQGYGKYENGKAKLNSVIVIKLAELYKVSIDFIFGNNNIFESALIPKTELQEVYDRLTPHQQELVMERVRAFDDANAERAAQKSRTGKTIVIPVRTTDETYE